MSGTNFESGRNEKPEQKLDSRSPYERLPAMKDSKDLQVQRLIRMQNILSFQRDGTMPFQEKKEEVRIPSIDRDPRMLDPRIAPSVQQFVRTPFIRRRYLEGANSAVNNVNRGFEYRPYQQQKTPKHGAVRTRFRKDVGMFKEVYDVRQGWMDAGVIKPMNELEKDWQEERDRYEREKAEKYAREVEKARQLRDWYKYRNDPLWEHRARMNQLHQQIFGTPLYPRNTDVINVQNIRGSGTLPEQQAQNSVYVPRVIPSQQPLNPSPRVTPQQPSTPQAPRTGQTPAPQTPRTQPSTPPPATPETPPMDLRLAMSPNSRKFMGIIRGTFPEIPEQQFYQVLKKELGRDFTTVGDRNVNDGALLLLNGLGNQSELPVIMNRARSIQQELGISLTPFNLEKFGKVYSLIALGREPYSMDVLQTLRRTGTPFQFSFQQPRELSLEMDRSSIAITAKNLSRLGYNSSLSQDVRTNMILQEWRKLKQRQEESFTQGPDVASRNAEGKVEKRKPIDLLVISENGTGAFDLTNHAKETLALSQQFNQDPSLSEKGSANLVWVNELPSFDAVQSYILKAQEQAKASGHHLAVFSVVHGSPDGMSLSLNGRVVRVPMTKMMEGIDQNITTVFSSSCYSGAHAARIRAIYGENALRGVNLNVQNLPNSMFPDDFDHYVIEDGFKKGSDGFSYADVNKDGHVTLGEVRYWMDRRELFNDPTSYDAAGEQLTDAKKLEGTQLA